MSKGPILSDEQFDLLKTFVKLGRAPESIANYFNIAVSTVHNYKNKLKKAGVEFPDLRGKRPKEITMSKGDGVDEILDRPGLTFTAGGPGFTVYFNGVKVKISPDVNEVNITKEGVEVIYDRENG